MRRNSAGMIDPHFAPEAGCQYKLGITMQTYARYNKIGDKSRPPQQGEQPRGGDSKVSGHGQSLINTGKEERSAAIIPEENPTIGIGQASQESERIKHERSTRVAADLSIFAGNPKLSQHLLDALEHFAGRKITNDDTTQASAGFSVAYLEKSIMTNASYRTLTYVYTQGWTEYKKAGGRENETDSFFILVESLLEQLARGNPTAATNKLEIGKGNLPGETDIIGIRHRDLRWLLYDNTGTPYPGVSGSGFRDKGYIGSRLKPEGGFLDSFQLNIAKIEDEGLRSLLNSLRQDVGDPTRITLQAAQFIFDNIEILKNGIIQEVPAKVKEGLSESLKYFVGFMAGEAASSFLMRTANPTLAGIGLALKALLKAAEYVMDVDMIGDAASMLYEAGRHLVKVEKREDGTFTKLSERHLRDARAPIVALLTQIGLFAGMKAGGKVIGIIAKLRAGGKAKIHCSFCTITDAAETPGDAQATSERPPADAPKTAAAEGHPPTTGAAETPLGEAKGSGTSESPGVGPKAEGKPTAESKAEGQALPEQQAAQTPELKWKAAERNLTAAQARLARFQSLKEALTVARRNLQSARNRQVISRGGSVESNAAVRDAQAQISGIADMLQKEFGVDPKDVSERALATKELELANDLKQAKQTFTPLDVQLDPKKYRAKLPCFAAGTPVATPTGFRPIESLTAGDKVIAFDFQLETFAPALVLGLHESSTDQIVRITMNGQEIRSTRRHPFWVDDVHGWVEARALQPGMQVKTLHGPAVIERVATTQIAGMPTFNLHIAGLSTFCVGPGAVVHNEGIDAGQGGSYIIYRLTNSAFPGKCYIGQTTTSGKSGKARGATIRLEEHVREADIEIAEITAELAKNPPPEAKAKLEERLNFFNFKKGANPPEVLVYGIANQAQADWLEQQNIDVERQVRGSDNVLNRRNQISPERLQQAKEEIMKDPKVKCP